MAENRALDPFLLGRKQVQQEGIGGGGLKPPANRNTPPPIDMFEARQARGAADLKRENLIKAGKEGVYVVRELPNGYSIARNTEFAGSRYEMLSPLGRRFAGSHDLKVLVAKAFKKKDIEAMGGIDAMIMGIK